MKDLAHLPNNVVDLIKKFVNDKQQNPEITAIILTGSFARGDFSKFSDIDITTFHDKLKLVDSPKYDLIYNDNYLFSLSNSTILEWLEKIDNPKELIFIYHAIHDSVILFDRNDEFQALKDRINPNPWVHIDDHRVYEINYELRGYVEELYKLLKGIDKRNRPLIAYALFGLIHGLTTIMALHAKLIIDTENNFYSDLLGSEKIPAKWKELFVASIGLSETSSQDLLKRGEAGVELFLETVEHVTLDEVTKKFLEIPVSLANELLKLNSSEIED